jgi:hypothetical protein
MSRHFVRLTEDKKDGVQITLTNYQLVKETLRQFESAQTLGDDNPLPARTDMASAQFVRSRHFCVPKRAVNTLLRR